MKKEVKPKPQPISEIPLYKTWDSNTVTTSFPISTGANQLSWTIPTAMTSNMYEPSTMELVAKINEVIRALNERFPLTPQKLKKPVSHASSKKRQSKRA